MTLFEILWPAFFLFGGAFAGFNLAGWPGAIVGGPLGLASFILLSYLLGREGDRTPDCLCGQPGADFSCEVDEKNGIGSRCVSCGRLFFMRHGNRWLLLEKDGTLKLVMKRRFLGGWRTTSQNSGL